MNLFIGSCILLSGLSILATGNGLDQSLPSGNRVFPDTPSSSSFSSSGSSSSSSSSSSPKYDARLRRFGIYQEYASAEILTKAKGHHVFRGDEDSIIEINLPSKCEHIGGFYDASYLHGQFTLNDGVQTIISGSVIPSSTHCLLLFSPEPDYFGEIYFWFTVDTNALSTASTTGKSNQNHLELYIGTILVTPTRDPPIAIDDDTVTTTAGQWIYVPVLANDEDTDVTVSPVCTLSDTSTSSSTSTDNAFVRVRVLVPYRSHPTAASRNWMEPPKMPNLDTRSKQDILNDVDTPPNLFTDHPLALVSLNTDNNLNNLKEPLPCKLETNISFSSIDIPVKDILACTVTIPVSRTIRVIESLMVTVLPSIAPGSPINHQHTKPFIYALNFVPVNTTLVIRHEDTRSPQLMYPDGYMVHYANVSLPSCQELRILTVSDPLHGQAIAVPLPVVMGEGYNQPRIPSPMPGGGPVSFTQGYSPAGKNLPILVAYHPDPGYVGTDTFSYDIGDGIAGNGQKVTGTVTVTVHPSSNGDERVNDNQCLVWKCSIQTYDGRYNTYTDPDNGAIMTPLRRLAKPAYGDGIDTPAGSTRPSTRVISNELFHQADNIYNTIGLSELSVHFGQFLTHDIDFSTPLADYKAEANFVIPIPEGDPWFEQATMRFRRSGPQLGTGAGTDLPRQQLNKITSWLDLNVIYGTMTSRNRALRTLSGGKLLHMLGTEQYHNNTQGIPNSFTLGKTSPHKLTDEHCFTVDTNDTSINCRPVRGFVEHLSLNVNHLPNLNLLGRPRDSLFISGDNRANVQPGLVAMHTLLAREHNTIADEIQAALLVWQRDRTNSTVRTTDRTTNPHHDPVWRALHPHSPSYHTPSVQPLTQPVLMHIPSVTAFIPAAHVPYPVPLAWPHPFDGSSQALKAYDEAIFQTARAINRAKWQAMVWYEWLPVMLGPEIYASIPPFTGYHPSTNAAAANEFATAAFRFGHSQIGSVMKRIDSIHGCPIEAGAISLRDAYFTATRILSEGGIDPVLAGSIVGFAQDVDTFAVNEIRNLLFATHTQGFDLIAFNIQRGRDHGLPDYNTLRETMGLPRITSFNEISTNPEIGPILESLYRSVDDIDAVVGGLAETHVKDGAVGPLFASMIKDQFIRIRDGDRFWFENKDGPQTAILATVGSIEEFQGTRIADYLARSTDVLDGRFGAELVWSLSGKDQLTDASGTRRTVRNRLTNDLTDSLFYARPSVLSTLNKECDGVYSDSADEMVRLAALQRKALKRSLEEEKGKKTFPVAEELREAMAAMGVDTDGDAQYV